jgi:hypothetical protein
MKALLIGFLDGALKGFLGVFEKIYRVISYKRVNFASNTNTKKK